MEGVLLREYYEGNSIKGVLWREYYGGSIKDLSSKIEVLVKFTNFKIWILVVPKESSYENQTLIKIDHTPNFN